MTLPQETIDKIKADAQRKYPLPLSHTITTGPREAHIEAATEWAENAQILVDALQLISQTKSFTDKEGFIKQIADNALAKYKEASNG